MPDMLVRLGGGGLLIVALLFGLVGILMPFSMYAAQNGPIGRARKSRNSIGNSMNCWP
jgi:hypothetical protein